VFTRGRYWVRWTHSISSYTIPFSYVL